MLESSRAGFHGLQAGTATNRMVHPARTRAYSGRDAGAGVAGRAGGADGCGGQDGSARLGARSGMAWGEKGVSCLYRVVGGPRCSIVRFSLGLSRCDSVFTTVLGVFQHVESLVRAIE